MIQDHTPVAIQKFNGLYGIDSFDDSVPEGYFIDALNTITYGDEVKTRDGFGLAHSTLATERFKIYRRQGESARILYLDNSGNIRDLTTDTIILTVAGMTDFAMEVVNNRAYISPHNGNAGLPGSFVYVYTGSGTARKAAGASPVGSFTASISATSGVIESGVHLFAWVYETTTGFVTPPSSAQSLTFDGTKAVDFSNIPVGPAGTAARRLIASRAIQDYNGNELAYEMFFVPGGRINDNSTTSLSGVNFYDAELIDTADYTYDQLEEIPAVVFLVPYGRRLTYGGPDIDKNLVYFSKIDEPESISSLAGFIAYDPFESEGVKDATEFRDNFYVTKRDHTYTIRDNQAEPSTWGNPIRLDQAIGANINGIAQYKDSKGARVEFFLVADESGLYKFNGIYEEIPITRNIKNWWYRINKNYFHKIQVVIDQKKMLIYILVPLDASVSPNYIIVGDFENGFALDKIRWHLWSFSGLTPSSIAIDLEAVSKQTILKFSDLTGNIYKQEIGRTNDNSSSINNYIKFAMVGGRTNAIHHIGMIGLRVVGSGNLAMEVRGQDNIEYQTLPSLALSTTPGREFQRPSTFQSERISFKLSLNNVGSYFRLRKVTLYINQIYESRPGA